MKHPRAFLSYYVPLVVSLLAMLMAGWQAWTAEQERDTPLQALLYASQLTAVQSLIENARIGCGRRICTSYSDPSQERMEVCKGATLDEAFAKVEEASDTLNLISAPSLVDLVTRFNVMHRRHAFNEADDDTGLATSLRDDVEARRWALNRKCHREIDTFLNEFRGTMGIGTLSQGLLSRVYGSNSDIVANPE